MTLRIQVLTLLISAQIWPSMSQFVFELEVDIDSVTAGSFNCDIGFTDNSAQCRIYFSVFCLREGRESSQSTNTEDCPLGRNTKRLNTYENQPNTARRRITSKTPWPGVFQLYIKAWDSDPGLSRDDDLDDIIINRALELNTSFTEMKEYTGILKRVTLQIRFRVMCQQDYYGTNCSTFCLEQNDDMNGHYTCNSDGSIRCLEGFENLQNNCKNMMNPCDSSSCANNGSCTSMGPFDHTCQCAVGYTGPSCKTDINDCLSATCPNNSMCEDGINSFKCICNPGFMLDRNRCVAQIGETQRTPTVPSVGSFTTGSASEESRNKKGSSTILYVVALVVALIVIALIVFIVVLIVVIIKRKGKRTRSIHQDGKLMESLSAKMVDNPTYEQLSESNSVIYEVPKDTSLEATVHVVDNPIYGEDVNYNPISDGIIRNVQNPIYGDDVGKSTQDRLYEVAHEIPSGAAPLSS